MSIMDMFKFGGNTQQQQQQPTQQQPGNLPNNGGAADPSNPTLPNPAIVDPAKKEESPLANFAELWKPTESKSDPQDNSFLGPVDPAKVMEAAKRTDFTKVVTPEQMQKIAAGGQEAVTAMMEAMNSVTQAAFAQSAMTSAKLVEQALSKAESKFTSDLPQHFKKMSVSENLRNENPIFNNPAVSPIISALEFQLTQKYPNASSSEITKMAKEYISDFGNAVVPKPQEEQNKNQSQEYDWTKFIPNQF